MKTRMIIVLLLIVIVVLLGSQAGGEAPWTGAPKHIPLFRFWSPVLCDHFYTASVAERNDVLMYLDDVYVYEGIVGFVQYYGDRIWDDDIIE